VELSLLNEDGSIWYPEESESNSSFKSRIKPLVKEFLHGKWFEKHVENSLNGFIKSRKLQVASNVKIFKKTGGKDFELDLVLINGYQTTVISCTTSGETHLCKSKGFEVLHRSMEFGGEESKAVLICGKEKEVDILQDDLNKISNIGNRKLLILGIEDWKKENLVSEIEDFIFY